MADQIVLDFIVRAREQGVAGAAAAVSALDREYDKNQKATAAAAASQAGLNRSLQQGARSAESMRYAQYDMSRTLLTASAAMTALGVASVAAFASQEKGFTEVERILAGDGTAFQAIGNLREQLVGLSEQIPLTFGEISEIAAFGAALDIPAEALDSFTDTVSRFAALTGVTTEQAGKGLARLAQYAELGEGGYEQLGSAILRAGNISIATESDVLRFSQALAPLAARSEVTADQIVGLSAATASFTRINVEGAGSAFSRVFAQIDRAVATGGSNLESFAQAAGLSADEFVGAWTRAGGGSGATFQQIIKSMAGSSQELALQLDNLNIRNVRDRRVIEGLVLNYEKYAQIQADTTRAFQDGTALGDAYAFVLDDLATKFQLFLNSAVNAASALGGVFAPAVGGALDALSGLLQGFRDFAESTGGRVFLTMTGTVLAAATAWAALRGAIALATASTLAFRSAVAATGSVSIASGLSSLAGIATGVGTNAATAATQMSGLAGAAQKAGGFLGGLVRSIGPLGAVIGVATAGLTAFTSELARIEEERIRGLSAEFAATGVSADALYDSVKRTFAGNINFAGFTDALRNQGDLLDRNKLLVGEQEALFGTSIDTINAAGQAAEDFGNILNGAVEADPEGGLARSQAYLRAYRDEFNLSASDIRAFLDGPGAGYKQFLTDQLEANNQAVTSQSLYSAAVGEGTAATRLATGALTDWEAEAIASAEAADLARQNYDELKEAFLGLASTSINAAAAQDEAQKSLNGLRATADKFKGSILGTSNAAIDFREQIRQLEEDNRLAAVATLENGRATDKTRESFKKSRTALIDTIAPFFDSRAAAKKWAEGVLGDTDDALAAIEDVGAGLDDLDSNNPTSNVTVNSSGALGEISQVSRRLDSLDGKTARTSIVNTVTNVTTRVVRFRDETGGRVGQDATLAWSSGGYTGRGGKYEPAGIVHKGEYVVPKHMVNQSTGLPYADAMGKLTRGEASPAGYANGGFVQAPAAPSSIALTPGTIQQIARAVQHVTMLDSQSLTAAVNAQNTKSSLRGNY